MRCFELLSLVLAGLLEGLALLVKLLLAVQLHQTCFRVPLFALLQFAFMTSYQPSATDAAELFYYLQFFIFIHLYFKLKLKILNYSRYNFKLTLWDYTKSYPMLGIINI